MRLGVWTYAVALATGVLGCASPQQGQGRELESSGTVAPLSASTASEETFTAFESGQVRPLALSPDGKLLFAVNTPDNRLEIFKVSGAGLEPQASVMVGLEPVAVAARSTGEVWVVNHLSDSISVVDVSKPARPVVRHTLLVGDEPRDIVFARGKAYITTAHRGQNTGRDPQLTTPGVGRADVWVFDPSSLGHALAGAPVTVITLFADTPRALAVSKDQKTVYAAAFASGNRTATLTERLVTTNAGLPAAPSANVEGAPAPWGGLIVKYRLGTPDGQYHWLDELNRIWDEQVRFSLPDKDVFAIDATLKVPAQKKDAAGAVPHVGTVLFNMAVNPVSGKVYVSNLEARNEVRFEGMNHSGGTGSVRGHIAENRISIIDGSQVTARHLNKHIDYTVEGTPEEAAKSLAFPTGMEVSADGKWLYVAALGSSKLGIFRTAELESNTFHPSSEDHVPLTGGGPTGLVLGKAGLAYVMTRFDNGISVVDTAAKTELAHLKLYNPEPASLVNGRKFLYDAALTSAHGDSACASCHIFGDVDQLAWDLGDPDGQVMNNPGPFNLDLGSVPRVLHPMKGPMTTQSLRGLANHGPMHWRGDRTGGNDVPQSAQPDTGAFDEVAAFKKFNPAFTGLLGRGAELSESELQAFTDFALQLSYPPNPIRNLDNSLTLMQAAGRDFYFRQTPDGKEVVVDTFHNCNGCHRLEPTANAEFGVKKPGFFGTDGQSSFDVEPQLFKVPHLRNAYTKVGMFGMAPTFNRLPDGPIPLIAFLPPPLNDESFMGDQIRGFGFTHDGSIDTLFRFGGANVFAERPAADSSPANPGIPIGPDGLFIRRALEAFVLAFDSNLAPIVGQQVTLTRSNGLAVAARIALLQQRAAADECDLVVRGNLAGEELGFLYLPESGKFAQNRAGAAELSETVLRLMLWSTPLTFTAVPPGSGERIALDRDSDGVLDGDAARELP